MVYKVPFSDIRTFFDAYIKPYHKEDIPGFFLTYGVYIRQGVHLVIILTPLCRSPIYSGDYPHVLLQSLPPTTHL